MNKETSIYLDLIRFTAAIAVFVGHVSGERLTGGLFWQVGPYGPEAVDVFFVLSGFVIAFVHDTREHDPITYAVSRLARIYSVALPALAATLALDTIGRSERPWLYSAAWHYVWNDRVPQWLHALTFTNQLWFNDLPPGSDFPFWSLGYEVWYYVIFGLAVFLPRRWRWPVVLGMLVFVGPKVAAMFPIWLMGVGAYCVFKSRTIRVPVATIMAVGAFLLWVCYEMYVWHAGRPIYPNWIGRPPIWQDYIIGTLFCIHLIGFRFVSHVPGPLLVAFRRPIRWCAGATLTLYLFHLPLSQFIAAETPWSSSAWQTRMMVFVGVPLTAFAISMATERRKNLWRRGFDRLLRGIRHRWLPQSSTQAQSTVQY
ncbi:MAG TPA: acyltransferase [Acidocella sp.]|jgi:peptidoglycan/LPS O-acetylase OafA/YrhL|nr:acyltransferase [Acidocella sp.]